MEQPGGSFESLLWHFTTHANACARRDYELSPKPYSNCTFPVLMFISLLFQILHFSSDTRAHDAHHVELVRVGDGGVKQVHPRGLQRAARRALRSCHLLNLQRRGGRPAHTHKVNQTTPLVTGPTSYATESGNICKPCPCLPSSLTTNQRSRRASARKIDAGENIKTPIVSTVRLLKPQNTSVSDTVRD